MIVNAYFVQQESHQAHQSDSGMQNFLLMYYSERVILNLEWHNRIYELEVIHLAKFSSIEAIIAIA